MLTAEAVQRAASYVDRATEILSEILEELDEDGGFHNDVYVIYNRLSSLKDDLEELTE